MLPTSLVLLAAAKLVSAHFGLEFPAWRADTLAENTSYSQWQYPCAGAPVDDNNRTAWPLKSGSLQLALHHPWTYLFVNLGLGDNVTNFNYTLTPTLWNETGKGTFCIDDLPFPEDLRPREGQKGTVQVVTVGDSGSALYNCADIVFRSNATKFGGAQCSSTSGVSYTQVTANKSSSQASSGSSGGNSSESNSGGGGGKNAAGMQSTNMVALTTVVGLTLVFVSGYLI